CDPRVRVPGVAARIINTPPPPNHLLRVQSSKKSGALDLGKYGLTLTSAPYGSTSVSIPADASDVTFEAKWARVMASAPVSAVPIVPQHVLERVYNVPLPPPHPLAVPQSQTKPE